MSEKVYHCTECGSTNLGIDAYAVQNDDGSWELGDTYDKYVWCRDCGDMETSLSSLDWVQYEQKTSEAADPSGDPPEARPV